MSASLGKYRIVETWTVTKTIEVLADGPGESLLIEDGVELKDVWVYESRKSEYIGPVLATTFPPTIEAIKDQMRRDLFPPMPMIE